MPASSPKLENLYNCLLTDWPEMEAEILAQIRQPADTDTHRLSLLLDRFPQSVFLQPVQEVLAGSAKTDAWTHHYLYAAASLMEASTESGLAPEGLQDKLIDWVLNYNGETPMFASRVLCYFTEKEAEDAMLQKIMANDDFHLTLISCMWGLLGIDRKKYSLLIAQLAEEETYSLEFREVCRTWMQKEAGGLNL